MSAVQREIQELTSREYKYGFVTELETDVGSTPFPRTVGLRV